MTFTKEWEQELAKPLVQANVKSRSQAGRSFSYIESHHAIREANTIFGHGEWSYSIDDLKMVAQYENSNGNHVICYTAILTVKVNGTFRQDTGYGEGISKHLGQAHESATKEAVSDALKRCLRTFGDRFGLALYDKELKHVIPREQTETYDSAKEKLLVLARSGNKDDCKALLQKMLAEKVLSKNDSIISECKELLSKAA